jgi:hypothetical protein
MKLDSHDGALLALDLQFQYWLVTGYHGSWHMICGQMPPMFAALKYGGYGPV